MEWKLITSKQYPIFSRYWSVKSFNEDMKDTLGIGFNNYKSLYNGIYADTREFEQVKLYLLKKLNVNIKIIWNLCNKWKKDCDNLVQYAKEIGSRNFSKYDNHYLVNLLERVVSKFRKSTSYIFLHHTLGDYFEEWLNDLLDKKELDNSVKNLYFQILSSPIKKTKLTEAENQLKKIANILRKHESKYAKILIKDYTSRYRWMGYDTGVGKDLTIAETKDKVDSILNTKEFKFKTTNRNNLIKELDLSDKEKQFLDLISEIIYMGYYRVESSMIAGSYIRPLLEEIARRLDISYEDIVQLTLDEIEDAINSGKLDFKEIKRRKNKYGILLTDGKITIFSGHKVDKIEEKTDIPENISELKGIVANRGKAKGYAKIVLNKNDFKKVNLGDILVSKTTNPDFIVVLQKCSAIITDIGGITSHAAVIARELNKPCIIGTKYATQLLKDGDLIEIDTNNGVVLKLNNIRYKKLSRFLTRDMPLIAVECWYKGGTIYFKNSTELDFPICAYKFNNGAFEFLRHLEDFESKLPNPLALWVKNNEIKLKKMRKQMSRAIDYFNASRNLSYSSADEILKRLEIVADFFSKGFLDIVLAQHVPRFCEEYKEKGQILLKKDLVNKLIKWRNAEANLFFNEGVETINFLLQRIAGLNNWNPEDLHHLTLSELRQCIKSKKYLPVTIAEKRKNSIYFYFDNKVLYKDNIKAALDDFGCYLEEELCSATDTIEGNIANRGKAKGIVKIVYARNQLNSFNDGDILVAPMTTVWYTPIIEKSAAIITDEGGITCHAAIISREMNKPCIIGTKYATKVLKDGDFVEVDANRGIVRKI